MHNTTLARVLVTRLTGAAIIVLSTTAITYGTPIVCSQVRLATHAHNKVTAKSAVRRHDLQLALNARLIGLWSSNDQQFKGIDKLKALLAAGADVNCRDQWDQTPLMKATRLGSVDCIRVLINHGAAVNARSGYDKGTALMIAAGMGNTTCANLLLAKGADIKARTNSDITVLMMAVSRTGDVSCVRLLVAHGADVNAKNKYGLTALKLAKADNLQKIADVLLAAGAKE